MSTSTSAVSAFLLLFCLLSPFLHISCRMCSTGNNAQDCKCQSGHFLKLTGKVSCERCTEECSNYGNQIERDPCSQNQNRRCFCRPGFYCKEKNIYDSYCYNACDPCKAGTFSSSPSLNQSCKPHTDCAKLGMIVFNEGTATQDTVCISGTTVMSSTLLVTKTTGSSDTMTTGSSDTMTTGSSDTMTTGTSDTMTTGSSDTMTTGSSNTSSSDTKITDSSNIITSYTSSLRSSNTITTGSSKVTIPSSAKMSSSISSDTSSIPVTVGGAAGRLTGEHQSLWLLMFLLLILFSAGFCLLTKGKAKKTISKCFGFVCEKHKGDRDHRKQTAGHYVSSNHSAEPEMPLGSDVREVKGQNLGTPPQSGGVQQVTMKHNGKGENVSNTVGSIYIYSSGTVILGSNSGDKKKEAGACEEHVPLISKPQQESNPPSQEVRIRMSAQEEAEEEELSLRFPVPATGK